ncbi:MAG: hypothetical protein KDI51_18545, partial [Xanthomonadales bacterium]|nr:hypothetical protein [Xanthomonadales bacterium]
LGEMGSGVEALEAMGFDSAARYAIYGYGLMPVYRMEVAHPERFAQVVERIESKAGKPLPRRTIGEATLYQLPASQADVLFGIVGGHLLTTLAPPQQDEATWAAQLGLQRPQRSLLDTNALAKLDQEQGYTGHGSGYVDTLALFDRLTRSAKDRQLLADFGLDVPELDEACATEIRALVAHFPRLVAGSTAFETKSATVVGEWQTSPELAAQLRGLATPMPGAAGDPAPFRFAMAVNPPAALRLAASMASAVIDQPFACEHLAAINDSAAQVKAQAESPAMAMSASVKAFSLGLTDLQLDASNKPVGLSGFLAVGSGSPMMLWSLAQQARSELAQVSLPADGQVVPLPDGLVPGPLPLALKARMNDRMIAVATQDLSDDQFIAGSDVPADSDGTFLRYGLSGSGFALMSRVLPAPPDEMDPQQAQELNDAREMMRTMGEAVADIDVQIRFGDEGIEYVQSMRLN